MLEPLDDAFSFSLDFDSSHASQYCILEKSEDLQKCVWNELPAPHHYKFSEFHSEGVILVHVWVKNERGKISDKLTFDASHLFPNPPEVKNFHSLDQNWHEKTSAPMFFWDEVTDFENLDHYRIELRKQEDGSVYYPFTNVGLVTSYQFLNLSNTNESSYTAVIQAVDSIGNIGPETRIVIEDQNHWKIDLGEPPVGLGRYDAYLMGSVARVHLNYLADFGVAATSCIVSELNNLEFVEECSCVPETGQCFVDVRSLDPEFTGLSSLNFEVRVNDMLSETSTINLRWIDCPSGYIPVGRNPEVGVNEAFCIMKYPAKNNGFGQPVSQPENLPWVGVDNPHTTCQELGANFDVVSNPEAMAVARNLEGVSSNWSSGTVGEGMLPRGHSDGTPDSKLAVSDPTDPYDGTGNNAQQGPGEGWEQRRTFHLSNGHTLWDFAGNTWEFVDWVVENPNNTMTTASGCDWSWSEIHERVSACSDLDSADASAADLSLDSENGIGKIYGGSDYTVRRGGHWSMGEYAGIYALDLGAGSGSAGMITGFRCVWWPEAPEPVADPCENILPGDEGSVCANGMIYVGPSPSTSEPTFMTNINYEAARTWNNGTDDYEEVGTTNSSDGLANTEILVGLLGERSDAPYEAAMYCHNLEAHGFDDWFLPARNEINLIWNDGDPLGDIDQSGVRYWSSTERATGRAWRQRYSDGQLSGNYGQSLKTNAHNVRCMRRQSP